jgi:ATP-dependent DNA helicase RecG
MIQDLLRELNELDEHPTLEAKTCAGGSLGDSFFETVCAFCNEPDMGGGRVVLGVVRDAEDFFGGYEVTGVGDPDKLLQDIASGCASIFNLPVRPRTISERYGDKTVIIVEVDELSPAQKPLYFQKQNLPRGAWRRIGSTDQRCTEDDLVVFYGNRQGDSYDLSVMRHATMADLDAEAILHYRKLREKANPLAEELGWDDLELLQALNAIRKDSAEWRPTLTGLLLFGTRMAQRRELPAVRVDYIRVPGKEWVDDPDRRFLTTVDMRGPLLQLVDRAQVAVMDDLPKGFELKEGQIQADTPTLPGRVLREAIVNALMHRSYREHRPTQIIRYSNRIEIQNAGFSLKNEDQLGEAGSQLRNPTLAAAFHDTNTAETKGSGIRVMREQMRMNGFSPPTFESDRANNSFTSRLLLHHFLSEEDLRWLKQIAGDWDEAQRIALIFVREQGAINNQSLRQLTGSEVLAASQELRKLRDAGLLQLKGKGSATYYLPGPAFPPDQPADHGTLAAGLGTLAAGLGTLAAGHGTLAVEHGNLPAGVSADLKRRIEELGARPGDRIRSVIRDLCSIEPLSATRLALILGDRSQKALKREHLEPMRAAGELEYLYKDMDRHPKQAYRTPEGTT